MTVTVITAFDDVRSTATIRSTYVPGALNFAVVAPQDVEGGLLQLTLKEPSGASRRPRAGWAADSSFGLPSPKVTVPGPRNLLHHMVRRGGACRLRAPLSSSAAGRAGAGPTVGASVADWETDTVTGDGALTLGGGSSPSSSE